MTPLNKAIAEQRRATARLAATVADTHTDLGATPKEVVEALELLRYELHNKIDELIDHEETRRPPGGTAWRARRYRELKVPAA